MVLRDRMGPTHAGEAHVTVGRTNVHACRAEQGSSSRAIPENQLPVCMYTWAKSAYPIHTQRTRKMHKRRSKTTHYLASTTSGFTCSPLDNVLVASPENRLPMFNDVCIALQYVLRF